MSKPKKNKTNAVLYKEMTIDMKRPKIMIIMLLINMFLAPISFFFFLGIMISMVAGTPVGSTIVTVDVVLFLLCFAVGKVRG